MNIAFLILTVIFIIVAVVMILIILVQRPQGGGLAGAFGGAGGGGTDTVFGGRVGDALTVMTVVAFLGYLGLAIGLNLVPIRPVAAGTPQQPTITSTDPQTGETFTIPVEPSDPPPLIPDTPAAPVPAAQPAPQDEEPAAGQPEGGMEADPAAEPPVDEAPAEGDQADEPEGEQAPGDGASAA